MNIYDRANEKYEQLLLSILNIYDRKERIDVLISEYVDVENSLRVSLRVADEEKEWEYLNEYKRRLGSCILTLLIHDRGYYLDQNNIYYKREKEE